MMDSMRLRALALVAVATLMPALLSAQAPQAEAPAQQATAPQPYTLRTETNIVLVPATVEVKGQVLYGLKPEQFSVKDNGKTVPVKLDEDSDSLGLSLVVLLQCSRSAIMEYSKIEALPGMIEALVGGAPREVALVRYGSHPELVQPFTRSMDEVNGSMVRMAPCEDDKAATIDAISYGASILANRRDRFRRMILLISETRDHGSTVKEERVIQQLGRTNTVVNAVAFSPIKSEVVDDLKTGAGSNPLTFLFAIVQALRQNVPKTIARVSGGQYFNFTTKKGFEGELHSLTNRVHNYYLLSFSVPLDAANGVHAIDVDVPEYPNATVRARRSYWVGPLNTAPSK